MPSLFPLIPVKKVLDGKGFIPKTLIAFSVIKLICDPLSHSALNVSVMEVETILMFAVPNKMFPFGSIVLKFASSTVSNFGGVFVMVLCVVANAESKLGTPPVSSFLKLVYSSLHLSLMHSIGYFLGSTKENCEVHCTVGNFLMHNLS